MLNWLNCVCSEPGGRAVLQGPTRAEPAGDRAEEGEGLRGHAGVLQGRRAYTDPHHDRR